MSTSFIDEYMIKLGATVDASGMRRFQQALTEAAGVAEASAASIAGSMLTAQAEILGGFAAIGGAALGLADKVAMADQSYRLFALHMFMSKDAARSLKVAMDALGEPLENLTWDKELRERTHQLILDQRAMAPDGDFEAQMRKIRDIRFEFTRMEVEGQYLAMHVVENFMQALGIGPDTLLKKLQDFNNWVRKNIPEISARIVKDFLPVWHDVEDIAKSIGSALEAVGVDFVNTIGLLSGDQRLEGTTVSLEKMALAVQHIAHWFAVFAETINYVIEGVARLQTAITQALSGIGSEGENLLDVLPGGAAVHQALKGLGAAKHGIAEDFHDLSAKGLGGDWHPSSTAGTTASVAPKNNGPLALVEAYAKQFGIDPALAHALAAQESGERQYGVGGAVLTSRTGAMGVMQLLPSTARGLGVDPTNAEQNVRGGLTFFKQLLDKYTAKYHDQTQAELAAVGAYHEGEPKMDNVLAGRATLSEEARAEMSSVLKRAGRDVHGDIHIGAITVNVDKPNAVNADVANAMAAKLRDMQQKRVQRNLSEFQDSAWGYTGG